MCRLICPFLVLVCLVSSAEAARSEAPACPTADGRIPVLGQGQSRDVLRRLAPHRPGEPILGGPEGWRLDGVSLETSEIAVRLKGPEDDRAVLLVRASTCPSEFGDPSKSFSFALGLPPPSGPGLEAAQRVADTLRSSDEGGFWTTFAEPKPTARESEEPYAAEHGWPDPFGLPLSRSSTGLALLLVLALVLVAAEVVAWGKEALAHSDLGPTLVGVGLLTAAALGLRLLVDGTFLREAHPLLPIPPGTAHPVLGLPIEPYPQGPQLMFEAIRGWLSGANHEAWFRANVIWGSLTTVAAVALGRSLGGRTLGWAAGALLVFWPQHIRLSASESVHVALALWATIALALALRSAATGRTMATCAALAAAAATATMRPEAALWLAVIGVILVGAAPGGWRRLTRPPCLVVLGVVAWLLGPMLLDLAGTTHAARFVPGGDAPEAVGLSSLLDLPLLLVRPDGPNGFFDAATMPVWLWPLAVVGAVLVWRRGRRVVAGALVGITLGTLLLAIHLAPSGVVWPMARYHAAALPAVLALSAVGLVALVDRVGCTGRRRLATLVGVPALGCALWWPAMAVHMDWQQELDWLLELGGRSPSILERDARIITPDNRRRFVDMTPRDAVRPLTADRQHGGQALTVESALAHLPAQSRRPPVYYYEGLPCWLMVHPNGEEDLNPQCQAMHVHFELEQVAATALTGAVYLEAYAGVRRPGPVPIALYRVGKRRPPQAGAWRLPAPVEPGDPDAPFPMASGARQQMEPPEPPLR